MTTNLSDVTVRQIARRDELGLVTRQPFLLNQEHWRLCRRTPTPGRGVGRVSGGSARGQGGVCSRPGADAPMLLDVLDIDDSSPDPGHVDIDVHLLRTAIAATVPSGASARLHPIRTAGLARERRHEPSRRGAHGSG